MNNILLIDDDVQLGDLLEEYLGGHGMCLHAAQRPSVGLEMLKQESYDLVILDIMLPEQDGFAVCRDIRKQGDIPIIMLTARGDVMDRVVGLELGADDYMPKPFEPRELVARIQTILKRVQPHSDNKVRRFGGLHIDTLLGSCTLEGENINLTTMEYEMLELLTSVPGKVFSRDEILNHLKGVDTELYTRSVDILVSRLRQKLEPLDVVRTVRGRGYRFVGEMDA